MAGGAAFAYVVPKLDPDPADRYYACVSSAGKVKAGTMNLNVEPTGCPKATDTIRSWNAQGPSGAQGLVGPQGPAGLANIERVTGDPAYVFPPPEGLVRDYTATCPEGKRVLGGGYQTSGLDLEVQSSWTDGDRTWIVSARNAAGVTGPALVVVAQCASVG